MKYIIIYSLLFCGFTSARPQKKNFRLTRYDHFNDGYGNYRYAFQINNDVILGQNVELKLTKDNTRVTVANGAYSIVTPDNVIQEVRYVADEHGYRPHVVIAKQDTNSVNIHGVKVRTEYEKITSSDLVTFKPIKNKDISATTASPITSSTSTNALTSNSQEFQSETSTEKGDSHPQVVAENTKYNSTVELQTNSTVDPEDFPDRIGTPIIISLQGAPG